MRSRLARLTLTVPFVALLTVCESDLTTTEVGSEDPTAVTGRRTTGASLVPCPNCTFEPKLYTRTTGKPVTEFIEFEGNPDGAYTLETYDLGTRGAESRLWLNGELMKVHTGLHQQDVVLDWENTLEVRLTGKPQSKLLVRVFQEVASVTVTPNPAKGKIPATQQFTAVAQDRNGIEIPRQTFTWESGNTSLATINAMTGLAKTVGEVHLNDAWSYTTVSTGEGPVQIIAHADGALDKQGAATWTVVYGFVYTTYRAPPPLGPLRIFQAPRPFRYDETRLSQMAETCAEEASNTVWLPEGGDRQQQFKQCYPLLGLSTPTRRRNIFGNYVPALPTPNVGLYGRYCGAGHPDGPWVMRARDGGYQPKDPIDAMCMEHDRSEEHHELDPQTDAVAATCIVRYGIESENLHEEGVRIEVGSARWDAFWSHWPAMAEARRHWLVVTRAPCSGLIYDNFLEERGLQRPM